MGLLVIDTTRLECESCGVVFRIISNDDEGLTPMFCPCCGLMHDWATSKTLDGGRQG